LNLLFVVLFKWDVAGVAIATVLSQGLSAFLVLRAMTSSRGSSRLILKNLRLDWPILKRLLAYGVPAGLQGVCFSISNIVIQGAINTFGSQAIAGMTATVCLEWLLYSAVHSAQQTTIVFVGQNYGAGKMQRIIRSVYLGFGGAALIGIVLGSLMTLSGGFLLGLFNSEADVIRWGLLRIKIVFTTYFLCGLMDVSAGALRGLGHAIIPTVTALILACGFRVVWIRTVFDAHRSIEVLVTAYPLSWTITGLVNCVFLFWFCKKLLADTEKNSSYAALKSR
jgi:Na+-driven multidrug efflux pump